MHREASKDTLSRLRVVHAMRRQVIQRPERASIASAVNALIKYKVSATLVTDPEGKPVGVVSKTDIMGAYYAGVPVNAPLEQIMNGPPLFCQPDTSLSRALEIMRARAVYRLFVRDNENGPVEGLLAYPDIVGLLYRICRNCEISLHRRRAQPLSDTVVRYRVSEVMTPGVQAVNEEASLYSVMETLSAYRFGALLVTDGAGAPRGVVSKTDLALAYRRGTAPDVPVRQVMTPAVCGCPAQAPLEHAIRQMIFSDVHRLFVHDQDPERIVGTLSLSDAARVRSGSCHACVSSRIRLESL
ncbi:MAG: CBS domain-containing protein [Desulfosoma sp.]